MVIFLAGHVLLSLRLRFLVVAYLQESKKRGFRKAHDMRFLGLNFAVDDVLSLPFNATNISMVICGGFEGEFLGGLRSEPSELQGAILRQI
jgi:hypothetical protein